jgi:hypothetical protein
MKDKYLLFRNDPLSSRLGTSMSTIILIEKAIRFLLRSARSLKTFNEATVRKAAKPAM